MRSMWDKEMQRALEDDGEKLRQLTGEDHGPVFFDEEPYPGLAPCPHCFESSGYAARLVPATWYDPAYAEADPLHPCPYCNGTGDVECEDVTLEDLEERDAQERQSCTLGVGCDETGICYAVAHGQPEQCPCRNIGDCDGSCTHPAPRRPHGTGEGQ